MQKLINFFVQNYKLTVVITVGVIALGVSSLLQIRSESFPTVDFAMATVNTQYRGASAADIEALITIPLEKEIKKVSGIKDVRSLSQDGVSDLFIRVDMDNVHVPSVMSDLQKAVDRVTNLPFDLAEKPFFNEINSEEFPAIEIAVMGPTENRYRHQMARLMKEEIEDLSSVLEVRLVNYGKEEFQVLLDQKKLEAFNIGINEVLNAIANRNLNIPSGDLNDGKNKSLIKLEGKITSPEELEKIIIRTNFSAPSITLADVSEVRSDSEEIFTYARYNSEPATLMIVLKKAGTDTLKVVSEVEEKLKRFKELDDLEVQIYFNEAERVRAKLNLLSSNALTGFALVMIFLLIFLPGRIGLMASLSLPLCIMAVIGFMAPLSINIDTITVLAMIISLGMLVDNSVVVSENFSRLRSEGLSAIQAAITGVSQIWLPITATAMTTIAAFLPMLVTKGVMGRFILYIPIIITLSLCISLFESFFLLPMRLRFFAPEVKNQNSDWFGPFVSKFESLVCFLLNRRYLVFICFTLILSFSMFMMIKVNQKQLFPSEQIEVYIGRLELKEGKTLEQTDRVGAEIIERVAKLYPDHIKGITFRSGSSAVGAIDPKGKSGSHLGLALIYIHKHKATELDYHEVLRNFRQITHPEIVSLSFQEQVNGPPVGEPINATFRSFDQENLNFVVQQMQDHLRKVAGVIDVQDDISYGGQEILIELNHSKISRLGLTVKSIGDFLKTAFQGTNISTIVKDDEEVNINVRFRAEYRTDLENIKKLQILTPNGNLVRLKDLAQVQTRPGSPQLKRYDFKRAITVTGNVQLDTISSHEANQELLKIFNEKYAQDYPDVSITFGGEEESTKESLSSLAHAGLLAAIGIYAVLVFVFNSFAKPFLIMSTIPLGLLGITIAFWLHDKPISFLALVGMIGLAGIIVNNGIVLISFIDELTEKAEYHFHQALAKASSLRLRAVSVTSITTVMGLFPTAYGIGGSDPTLTSMTLAMAWGLTTGTILTLIWIPCGIAILADFMSLFGFSQTKE